MMQPATQQPDVPEILAAKLLTQAKGVRRDAEASAWDVARKYEKGSTQHRYWMAVIASLIDATELPAHDDDKGRTTREYRARQDHVGAAVRTAKQERA